MGWLVRGRSRADSRSSRPAIARDWAERRSADNEERLSKNPLYQRFIAETERVDNPRAKKVADKLIRSIVARNIVEDDPGTDEVVQMCIDFVEFDAFWELASELAGAELADPATLIRLFREWEVVEAKEMAKVTRGRITTIEKLARLIEENALEVPTLHGFPRSSPG